jgi:hypothetical protein
LLSCVRRGELLGGLYRHGIIACAIRAGILCQHLFRRHTGMASPQGLFASRRTSPQVRSVA